MIRLGVIAASLIAAGGFLAVLGIKRTRDKH